MSKNAVLITSILSLITSIVYNVMQFLKTTKPIIFIVVAVFWIAVAFVVFSDAKERGRKHAAWGGLCFLIGGIGGLIYYFTIKEK